MMNTRARHRNKSMCIKKENGSVTNVASTKVMEMAPMIMCKEENIDNKQGVKPTKSEETMVFDLHVNVDKAVKIEESDGTDHEDEALIKQEIPTLHVKGRAKMRLAKKQPKLPEKVSQQCSICETVLSSHSCLQKHLKLHFGEKEYKCHFCDRKYLYQSQAEDHERIHTDGKPNACRFCGKRFLLTKQVTIHERTHTLEKPFSCNTCDQSFSVNSTLVAHKRTHSGERPYRCDICGKNFRVQSKLARHMRSHTGDKPHKCRFCDKRFIRGYRVKQHEASQHYIPSLEGLKCWLCNKGFSSLRGVMAHKRKVHDPKDPNNLQS